jgi:hypothetical protein
LRGEEELDVFGDLKESLQWIEREPDFRNLLSHGKDFGILSVIVGFHPGMRHDLISDCLCVEWIWRRNSRWQIPKLAQTWILKHSD